MDYLLEIGQTYHQNFKSRNLYKAAISRFNNHVTVPLHQDIKSFEFAMLLTNHLINILILSIFHTLKNQKK